MEETNLPKFKTDSEETVAQIAEICFKNGIRDAAGVEKVAYRIASVLLGQLELEILPKTLQDDLKISAETAEKINSEVIGLISGRIPIQKPASPPTPTGKPEKPATTIARGRPDTYREQI